VLFYHNETNHLTARVFTARKVLSEARRRVKRQIVRDRYPEGSRSFGAHVELRSGEITFGRSTRAVGSVATGWDVTEFYIRFR